MGKLTSTIGIPIKLLNEAQVCPSLSYLLGIFLLSRKANCPANHAFASAHAQGHVVTLEITSGQVYRGKLLEGQCGILVLIDAGSGLSLFSLPLNAALLTGTCYTLNSRR
jgi:hypothetical protein